MTAPPGGSGRRPALDGLRGIAVAIVIVHHAMAFLVPSRFETVLPGGFLGVDLFFVLSGFLITSILLGGRRPGWAARFYSRRAWRLLPALVALLGGMVVLATTGTLDGEGLAGSALLSLVWLVNYAPQLDVATSPYLSHLWSLAVEGQFYLGWPILVVALRTRALLVAGAALAVVVLWRLHSFDDAWLAVYTRTDFRIDQPLVGACLALSPLLRRTLARLATPAAVAFAAAVLLTQREDAWLYQWGQTALAVAAAAMVAGALEGWGARVLAARPLVALGVVSYAAYLWHFPVLRWLQVDQGLEGAGPAVLGMALSIGLAALSWVLVEAPLKRWRAARVRRPAAVAAP